MKRVFQEAVDGGYDQVVITPGAEQASRYDLSQHIDTVSYSGTNFVAFDRSGDEVIRRTGVTPEDLPDLIGKDVAQRLMDQEPQGTLRTLSGVDLKTGDEGMVGFYDKMLPRFINKYGKKWGVRVGQGTDQAEQ